MTALSQVSQRFRRLVVKGDAGVAGPRSLASRRYVVASIAVSHRPFYPYSYPLSEPAPVNPGPSTAYQRSRKPQRELDADESVRAA